MIATALSLLPSVVDLVAKLVELAEQEATATAEQKAELAAQAKAEVQKTLQQLASVDAQIAQNNAAADAAAAKLPSGEPPATLAKP
jgi:DNA-binding protein H-NS